MSSTKSGLIHSSHWGAFHARRVGNRLEITPHPKDPSPSPQLGNFTSVLDHPARVARPSIRRSWLDNGPGPRKRSPDETFVEVEWEHAFRLVGEEVQRVRDRHGPEGIFGGSYGWASAGRFHHAQSQVHRFLNLLAGGYVRSVNSYSAGVASMLLPQIVGRFEDISRNTVSWDQIARDTDLILSFGGMALRNSAIGNGGVSEHIEHGKMREMVARGGQFHLFSPIRDDLPPDILTRWYPTRPGTDTALLLAMAYVLVTEDLADREFLSRCTVGFDKYAAYLRGEDDGVAKTPRWAQEITGHDAEEIAALARRLVGARSLITFSHSIQRAEFGEQPIWAGLALAAIVGQIGLPGGGYCYALGAMGHIGRQRVAVDIPTMPQGRNPCPAYIPVARVANMLLGPGTQYDYNGQKLTYPDIRLVYWAGGNPFHHHQDLARLEQAFSRPETIIVHESAWTASARAADIVLPASMTLERNDIGATRNDRRMFAMKRIAEPHGAALSDYEIFAGIAGAMGQGELFTEGLDCDGWLRRLWATTQAGLDALDLPAPDFDSFWDDGEIDLPLLPDDGGFLSRFRQDPESHPLVTPSGRIEIFSERIAAHGYDDCPGHPAWLPHRRQPNADTPFHVIANAPAGRLHSQLDFGEFSVSGKIAGREAVRLHPDDARRLGVSNGDTVRLENSRGACLAGVAVSDAIMRGVAHLQTGAWYDPQPDPDPASDAPAFCAHGNANVLTFDSGASRLSQGCTGQVTIARITPFRGEPPAVRAFMPPPLQT
ncbi:MAG: molybdopterin-dependent oxidoreductase [Mesorhizobium sp.]|nr:molybdopterin-dependent oxidoreductase [Mesorhizobium sp.]